MKTPGGARLGPPQAVAVLALALCFVAAADLHRAARRFLWFDELCTVAVVSRGTLAGMREALERGVDTMPPLYYLIERQAAGAVRDPHLGYRVPSLLAALSVPAALYGFARPRLGALGGLIAAFLPLASGRFRFYAVEARPYALVLACLAAALLVWQRLDGVRRACVLGGLLALATSLHYYALLGVAPLVLGEIARTRRREVRGPVWAAFALSLVPPLVSWPLLAVVKRVSGSHYWAPASLHNLPEMYGSFLSVGDVLGVGIGGVLLLGLLLTPVPAARAQDGPQAPRGLSLEDRVVALGYLCLPIVGYVAALVLGGGLTARYVLATLLGLSLAAAHLATRAGRVAAVCTLGLLVARFSAREVGFLRDDAARPRAEAGVHPEVALLAALKAKAGVLGQEVVISNGLDYVPVAYYSGTGPGSTLTLIDPDAALEYAGSDSVERTLTGLEGCLPLRLERFGTFAGRRSGFLLSSQEGDRFDWWPARLRADGYVLRALASESGRTLYRATPPPPDGAGGGPPRSQTDAHD